MQKTLALIIVVLAFAPWGVADQLVLNVYWSEDSFTLNNVHVGDGTAKTPKNGKIYTDYFCVGQDKSGKPVSMQEISLPNKFYIDGLDANGDPCGGAETLTSGPMVIRLPYDPKVQQVSLFKSWARSISVASMNRSVLSSQEPLATFNIPKNVDIKPHLAYSDVGNVHKVWGTGPDANRMIWAILAEGYTSDEQTKFLNDVDEALDQLFQIPIYDEYRDFINIYAVEVFSQESGCEHPGVPVSTAFESYFSSTAGPYIPSSMFSKVYGIAEEKAPGYDVSVILVNDESYGGAARYQLAVVPITPDLSGELMAHEVGHGLFDLDDEYYYSRSGDSCANIERDTTFDAIKWNHWIEAGTPLPTEDIEAYYDVIGAFGIVQNPGDTAYYYRPKHICKMRKIIDKPDFCEVCQEAMIVGTVQDSFYKLVDIVNGSSPEAGIHPETVPNYLTLSVQAMQTTSNTVTFDWYIDDMLVPSLSGASVQIPQTLLPDGEHDIKVVVTDETDRVRDDPEGFLTDQVEWTFTTQEVSGVSKKDWESY